MGSLSNNILVCSQQSKNMS
uniref:Uncharacterized protein n=1 Tax=Arundo donax TaxID=35708 RepID=A0A0A9EZA3_ARUDO